jgi:hypothetical protein
LIWFQGVLTPWNLSAFYISPQVFLLQLLRLVNTLPLVDADMFEMPPLDLSKATKLKDVEFRCPGPNIQWITMALQSIESKSLRQIIIHYYIFPNPDGETVHQAWRDLDRLLVQFWTSRAIRPKIKYGAGERENDLKGLASSLLPELTRRRVVDLLAA